MLRILKFILPILFFIPSSASAVIFTTDAIFSSEGPTVVDASTGTTVGLTADFGTEFESINRLTFTANFGSSDLLDTGEMYLFGDFQSSSLNRAYGFVNNFSAIDTRNTSLVGGMHQDVDLFLDGKEAFNFWMTSGSVLLTSVQITIDGIQRVPEPSTLLLFFIGIFALFVTHKVKSAR